jgi:hypothetical protein
MMKEQMSMDMTNEKRGRGGDVWQLPPPGYYTARESYTLLGMSKMSFYRRVHDGLITQAHITGRKYAYYVKEEIDLLRVLQQEGIITQRHVSTVFRAVTPEDAPGITSVLKSLGWPVKTPPERRAAWYQVNPEMDHVVVQGRTIMGYVSSVPYRESVMEQVVRGNAPMIQPEDILPFEDGHTYDLFVGLAERRKPRGKPHRYARYGMRLVLGFRAFLMQDLYHRNIRVRHLYGHSAEREGQDVAKALGFVLQEPDPRNAFPVYILDMEHSEEPWVQRYRALWDNT